jgi:hypothetical protein
MNVKTKRVLLMAGPLLVGLGAIAWINRKGAKSSGPAVVAGSKDESTAVTKKPATAPSGFPLALGVYNSDKVKELQKALGLAVADQDGDFGPKTQTALVAFAGVSQVDSQAQLDQIKNKAANLSTSTSRALQILASFQKGGVEIYVPKTFDAKGVTIDYAGAHVPTGTLLTLSGGKSYNNADYKIVGTTKLGMVTFQVTRGTFAGTYDADPSKITLKTVAAPASSSSSASVPLIII